MKNLIVGDLSPRERVSTPLAMRPTSVYRVNLDGEEWVKITTPDERKNFLARALVTYAPKLTDHLLANQVEENSEHKLESGSCAMYVGDTNSTIENIKPTLSSSRSTDNYCSSSLSCAFADASDSQAISSIATDEELVKLMDKLSLTTDPLAALRILQIIDSGGQPQFHELLPLFLRQLSYYLFVFRLCDELSYRPVVEVYTDGKPVGIPYTSSQTTEELLRYCVHTLSVNNNSNSESYPKIMVLGTHLDKAQMCRETQTVKSKLLLHCA